MKRIRVSFLLVAVSAVAALIASMSFAYGQAGRDAARVYVTKMPAGFRNWKWISVSHEAANINSIGAVLGNDTAFKAFSTSKLPYPDGSILAALHYMYASSAENDKVFGQPQSFVPGAPTNTQFMIKDSKKYPATGGWGFGQFNKDGTIPNDAAMKTCFPCHAMTKGTDLVFTHYAP